jgi:purine-binding chemotaxis protein CheW
VDGVQETFQVNADLMQPPPAITSGSATCFVDAILPLEGRMLSRLVVGALLPPVQSLAA